MHGLTGLLQTLYVLNVLMGKYSSFLNNIRLFFFPFVFTSKPVETVRILVGPGRRFEPLSCHGGAIASLSEVVALHPPATKVLSFLYLVSLCPDIHQSQVSILLLRLSIFYPSFFFF